MIRIHLAGPHARRTPLSYPWLWPLFAPHLRCEDDPARADLLIFAHPADLMRPPEALVTAWRQHRQPVLLLSEEPFWDTMFSPDPLARTLCVETESGTLPVIQLSHRTSAIYRFDRIPYYPLTDAGFASAYAARFRRNARLSAADWRAAFAGRAVDAVFMAERRAGAQHDVSFDRGRILGLCAWRTDLALAASGRVERLGASWAPGPSRFDLAHWHLDKIVRLDNRARAVSAIENTHQADYVSEKIFDAFACGSLPLYMAGPEHRLHRLGLPEGSWLNLWGLTPGEAAAALRDWAFSDAFFEAFQEAQSLLQTLFSDPSAWLAERARLARAVLAELTAARGTVPA
jgi:hypothetical protein